MPLAAEPHRWLGAAYYDLGLRSPAIAELEEAARLAPGDHRPHRLLGLIYYDFQQYGGAVPHYRRALELHDPAEQPDIVRELAHCLVELRNYEEALGLLKDAGRDPDLLVRRAEVHWGMGDHGAARRDVEAVLSTAPDDPRGNLLLARMELAADDVGPAIDRLRRARHSAPHDLSICYALASALRQAGMDREAEETFAEVKRLTDLHARYVKLAEAAAQAPANAGVRQELADVCRELGLPAVSAMWDRAARACQMVQGQETEPLPPHDP
jgi:tetratricopeptide (TPR) repeat protein